MMIFRFNRRGEARRGEARRGEARRGEARRGEARRGEARRGEARRDEMKALPVRALRNSNIFSHHSESAIALIYIHYPNSSCCILYSL